MPSLSLTPVFSLIGQISREPAAPFRLWLRTTRHKLRPSRPAPYSATIRHRQEAVLASGRGGLHQQATVLVEHSHGAQPTIVVGGFVPDATEALYLLRGPMLRQGSLYYFNYPKHGFSLDLFLAQLEDLIEEVAATHRRPPVLFTVSFGAGLVMEMLRRGHNPAQTLAGLLFVSPVACVEDLLDPTAPKPTTLLGRVIKPYLDSVGPADNLLVEKSRTVFLKMFESGAQNREALRLLLTRGETTALKEAVLGSINAIAPESARDRVRALRGMGLPREPRVLSHVPTLILFSEKESSVLRVGSPTEIELRTRTTAWFPRGRCLTVSNHPDNPVQHASLIFHAKNFQPPITAFYRSLRQAQRYAA